MTELGPASTARDIIDHLRSMRDERNIDGMARFGIETGTALGISNAVLRPLARRIKRDHQRALALWESDIREARLLAAFTDEPKEMTVEQARRWAADFNSWEIVDTVSDLYCDAGLQSVLIAEFARDEREFVRRTAFAMMAWSAVHMKKEPDATILDWLPLIERYRSDRRPTTDETSSRKRSTGRFVRSASATLPVTVRRWRSRKSWRSAATRPHAGSARMASGSLSIRKRWQG